MDIENFVPVLVQMVKDLISKGNGKTHPQFYLNLLQTHQLKQAFPRQVLLNGTDLGAKSNALFLKR